MMAESKRFSCTGFTNHSNAVCANKASPENGVGVNAVVSDGKLQRDLASFFFAKLSRF